MVIDVNRRGLHKRVAPIALSNGRAKVGLCGDLLLLTMQLLLVQSQSNASVLPFCAHMQATQATTSPPRLTRSNSNIIDLPDTLGFRVRSRSKSFAMKLAAAVSPTSVARCFGTELHLPCRVVVETQAMEHGTSPPMRLPLMKFCQHALLPQPF